MNRRLDALSRALTLTAVGLPLLSSSAAAQEEPRGASFELFGGASAIYSSDQGLSVHTDTFGVRGGFHLTRIWTVEAQLSQSRHDRLLLNGEVSAKAYLFQADRFRFFALAGPGIQYEYVAGDAGVSGTVHAGIGAEIDLTAKTYLRPEVRARWYGDHLGGRDYTLDHTLGFGWRF